MSKVKTQATTNSKTKTAPATRTSRPTMERSGQAESNLIEVGRTQINESAMDPAKRAEAGKPPRRSAGISSYVYIERPDILLEQLIRFSGTDYTRSLVEWLESEGCQANGNRGKNNSYLCHMEQESSQHNGESVALDTHRISVLMMDK